MTTKSCHLIRDSECNCWLTVDKNIQNFCYVSCKTSLEMGIDATTGCQRVFKQLKSDFLEKFKFC